MMDVVEHLFILLSIILIPSFIVNGAEIQIYTPESRTYTLLSSFGITATNRLIRFEVKACNNAYVGLIFGTLDNVYEIDFGGKDKWDNILSFIRVGKTRLSPRLVEKFGKHIYCDQYVAFWISWDDNTINIGQGLDVTGALFLSWYSETTLQTISGIGISTAFGATGEWLFYTQDETSTTEGQTTEGTTTDVTTTDVTTTDVTTTDGKTTDVKTTDVTTTDVTTTDVKTTDVKTTDVKTTDVETTDVTTTEGTTTEGQTTYGSTAEGQTTDGLTAEGHTTDGSIAEGQTTDGSTAEGQTTEGQTTDGTTTEDTPANDTTTEDIPANDITSQDTPDKDTTTEDTPANDTTTKDTPADSSTTDFQTTKPSDYISPPTSSARSLPKVILCTEYCTKSYTCNCEESLGTTTSSTPVIQYKVDKKTLSAYKRRYQSASDPRKSSFYIGCVGISVLVVSSAFIVILDFVPRA